VTDPEAVRRLTALYDMHHRQVHAYAMRRGDPQLADEVVTDTFMVAWRRIADVPSNPLPWLLGVARNLTREHLRRSARQTSNEDVLRVWSSLNDVNEPDPADIVADRDSVLIALAQLNEDDRELLTLIAWHGLSTAEAAEVVGCTTITCSVRLHRARRRLEQAMSSTSDVGRAHRATPLKPYLKDAV
jgi:RNA polymerase sigma-70 factor, ECF subfamily